MNQIHPFKPWDLTTTELELLEIDLTELLTRRRFLIGAGVLGLGVIAGCGAEDQAAAPTVTADGTRLFDHPLVVNGPVRIPANPQQVAMPHFEDLVPLLWANANIIAASWVEQDPLMQSLDALQNGQYVGVTANFSGTDLATAHYVLDGIAEAFGVADQFSPNPYKVKAPIPNG